MKYSVAVTDGTDNVQAAVGKAIELAGGFSPREGSLIAIKPNLCSGRLPPESGATTRPEVVEGIINYIYAHSKKCTIQIIEGDSDTPAEEAFRRLGYVDLANKYDVDLVNVSKDRVVKILPNNGNKLSTIEIPESLLFVDYLVSVANLKRQVNERMSGIWKNQWGCLPHKAVRMQLHPFLSQALFDLNSILWPDLSVIDGIVGLEGPGPFEGRPVYVGKILCSKDPISTDIVAARIIGESPLNVPHLKYAIKRLGRRIEDVETVGERVDTLNFKFISSPQFRLYRASFWLRRMGEYLENAGVLLSIGAFALRTAGISEFTESRVFSLTTKLSIAKDLLLKVEGSRKRIG